MQVKKNLGILYDDGEYITLPIVAEMEGKYKIRVVTPSGKEVQRIYTAVKNDALKLPNYNGRKALELGVNLIYIYTPEGNRLVIDGANKFEIDFKKQDFQITLNQNSINIEIKNNDTLILTANDGQRFKVTFDAQVGLFGNIELA